MCNAVADEDNNVDALCSLLISELDALSLCSSADGTQISDSEPSTSAGDHHVFDRLQQSPLTTQTLGTCLLLRQRLDRLVRVGPYDLSLHAALASVYRHIGHHDLAVGAAYKALMLFDACEDEGDEYHDRSLVAFRAHLGDVGVLDAQTMSVDDAHFLSSCRAYGLQIYAVLIQSLTEIGCLRTSLLYLEQGQRRFGKSGDLDSLRNGIEAAAGEIIGHGLQPHGSSSPSDLSAWPDGGMVRRECYQWNEREPSRLDALDELNDMMGAVAPQLEVRAVELPGLLAGSLEGQTVTQLGVFAKQDIAPGEIVLDETSMLTANSKLQDALCDACSAHLPELGGEAAADLAYCPDCEVVFCSQYCFDRALDSYHPALCSMDVEAIAKDAPPAESADALYALLLLRAFAMAETKACHPLDLHEVKYIWGDFNQPSLDESLPLSPTSLATVLKTLPFSFKYNVQLPFHMLEKMDVDIFASPYADVWVFNTLYAKLRGTASARLSGLKGTAARGPEVGAVHPMWCLANHSCDPNVSWEWGGSIKFWARTSRAKWKGRDGHEAERSSAGIRKGDEVLNHYCDVELSVKDRREWARGALGGDCVCARCVWEAAESKEAAAKPDSAQE